MIGSCLHELYIMQVGYWEENYEENNMIDQKHWTIWKFNGALFSAIQN